VSSKGQAGWLLSEQAAKACCGPVVRQSGVPGPACGTAVSTALTLLPPLATGPGSLAPALPALAARESSGGKPFCQNPMTPSSVERFIKPGQSQ